MTDQQILVDAIERAGVIIGEYIEPGHVRNAEQTVNRLIEVLDTQNVAAAIDRLNAGFGLRVVK